ncbi:MAG: intS, partial [Devosia sp.]|nr:intS [Devosia sp.]
VTESLLNHVSGSRAGIVGVYQRHGWDTEKRVALEAWSASVIDLAAKSQNSLDVIDLGAARRHKGA